jgi:hypothetical protein
VVRRVTERAPVDVFQRIGIVNRVEAARTTWGWVRGMSYPVSNMTVIADRDGMRADDD